MSLFDIAKLEQELSKLEETTANPDFWTTNNEETKKVLSEIKSYTPITYFVLLFSLIICFISVNIFAIEIIIYSNHTKPKKKTQHLLSQSKHIL